MIENNLTNGTEVDGKYTAWWVTDGVRATSLRIVRTTAEDVARLVAVAPSAAAFSAGDASLVGVHDHAPVTGNAETDSWAEDCGIIGRCFGEHYATSVAHPLFQAAAAAAFDDETVFALLAELHAKAGAR